MENKINLPNSLIDSVTGQEINELVADEIDTSIDLILSDSVLEKIPIVGLLYKWSKVVNGIREGIFAKKVLKFLLQLKDIPQSKKQEFINKLEEKKEYREKVGERLIMLIDQLDDMEKPEIVGRLFKAAIEERITYEEFIKLSSIVNKAFLADLKLLPQFTGDHSLRDEVNEHFATLGLTKIELRKERLRGFIGGGENGYRTRIGYELTNLGDLMKKNAF